MAGNDGAYLNLLSEMFFDRTVSSCASMSGMSRSSAFPVRKSSLKALFPLELWFNTSMTANQFLATTMHTRCEPSRYCTNHIVTDQPSTLRSSMAHETASAMHDAMLHQAD